jgi:hypothetical protein
LSKVTVAPPRALRRRPAKAVGRATDTLTFERLAKQAALASALPRDGYYWLALRRSRFLSAGRALSKTG